MTTTIALVRHGQTDWNLRELVQGVTDNPLNTTGRAQAAQTAELLKSNRWALSWSRVVTSPLIRAVQTGEVIAEAVGLQMQGSLPGLTERNYGTAEGSLMVEYPDGVYPKAEPNQSVALRSIAALAELHAAFPGEHLIVVAHGGLIRTLLGALSGSPVDPIENASVNIVEWTGSDTGWAIRAINNEMLVA